MKIAGWKMCMLRTDPCLHSLKLYLLQMWSVLVLYLDNDIGLYVDPGVNEGL